VLHPGDLQGLAERGAGFDRLTTLSNEGFLAQIDACLLHRVPDTPGLDYRSARLEQGLGQAAALDGIARSAEAVAQQDMPEDGLWSADPAALAVRQLYRATLGRPPDATGAVWWQSQLEGRPAGCRAFRPGAGRQPGNANA
jgi:hypothetical protein